MEVTLASAVESRDLRCPLALEERHRFADEGVIVLGVTISKGKHEIVSYTKFEQTLILPDDVKRDEISAKVDNGVLTDRKSTRLELQSLY